MTSETWEQWWQLTGHPKHVCARPPDVRFHINALLLAFTTIEVL